MNKKVFFLFAVLSIFSMLAASCNFPLATGPTPAPVEGNTTSTSTTPTLSASEVYGGQFASYQEQPVSIPEKFSGGYSLPLDLTQVTNLGDFTLTDTQKAALSQNGFVVTPPTNMYTEFYQTPCASHRPPQGRGNSAHLGGG